MPKLSNPGRPTLTGYNFMLDPAPLPAQAIRLRCLHCVGGERSEVRDCTATPAQCHLWPYRMGHGCDRSRNPRPPSRIKAMRRECLLCMGGRSDFVRKCETYYCHLWPYRLGRRPALGTERTPRMAGFGDETAQTLPSAGLDTPGRDLEAKTAPTCGVVAGEAGAHQCPDCGFAEGGEEEA